MLVAPVHIQDVPEALPVSEKRLQFVAKTLADVMMVMMVMMMMTVMFKMMLVKMRMVLQMMMVKMMTLMMVYV